MLQILPTPHRVIWNKLISVSSPVWLDAGQILDHSYFRYYASVKHDEAAGPEMVGAKREFG